MSKRSNVSRRVFVCGVLLSVWLWACARDPQELSPDKALTEFLGAVEASENQPALRKVAYQWLDQVGQAALRERASRTAALAGRKLEPWEMIVPGRLTFAGLRSPGVRMQVHIEGDKATVHIPIEQRKPVEVSMVRQEGRWRVVLGI